MDRSQRGAPTSARHLNATRKVRPAGAPRLTSESTGFAGLAPERATESLRRDRLRHPQRILPVVIRVGRPLVLPRRASLPPVRPPSHRPLALWIMPPAPGRSLHVDAVSR